MRVPGTQREMFLLLPLLSILPGPFLGHLADKVQPSGRLKGTVGESCGQGLEITW